MRHVKNIVFLLLLSSSGIVLSADSRPVAEQSREREQQQSDVQVAIPVLDLDRQEEDEERCWNSRNEERAFFTWAGFSTGIVFTVALRALSNL